MMTNEQIIITSIVCAAVGLFVWLLIAGVKESQKPDRRWRHNDKTGGDSGGSGGRG